MWLILFFACAKTAGPQLPEGAVPAIEAAGALPADPSQWSGWAALAVEEIDRMRAESVERAAALSGDPDATECLRARNTQLAASLEIAIQSSEAMRTARTGGDSEAERREADRLDQVLRQARESAAQAQVCGGT